MLKLDKEIEIFSLCLQTIPYLVSAKCLPKLQKATQSACLPSFLGRRPHASEAGLAVSPVAGKRKGHHHRGSSGGRVATVWGITRKKDIGLSRALKRISFRRI